MYSLIIKNNLKKTLEIGFAFGISTIYICQAHKDLNNSVNSHIVIDPFQTLNYNDIGVKNLEASGLSDFYSLKKEESWKVLSELDKKQLQDKIAKFQVLEQELYNTAYAIMKYTNLLLLAMPMTRSVRPSRLSVCLAKEKVWPTAPMQVHRVFPILLFCWYVNV